MKTDTLGLLQKNPNKLKTMITEIDQEISTLSDYLVHLNNMIIELKQDREELESFIENPKILVDVHNLATNDVKISGEYFYG
jgi:prefoldin subunit 5